MGTYLHGVFDEAEACNALLRWAGLADAAAVDIGAAREATYERLADCVDQHLDMTRVLALCGVPGEAA